MELTGIIVRICLSIIGNYRPVNNKLGNQSQMNHKQQYFNELIQRSEFLVQNPDRDNEASRHDQLVYPIITNEFGLGWKASDLISQSTINVPKQVSDSYIFRGSVPKLRKPDILICPPGFEKNIAVIEEKKKQPNISKLNNHRLQAHEYQALYECTWAVLTDGERWIVKRNFETFHEFSSIHELISGINDLKNCLGRAAVIERLSKHNTSDIILIVTEPSLIDREGLVNSNSELFGYNNEIPVIVCGVDGQQITSTGGGYKNFSNLQAALNMFPDLHPRICTERFTWAMKEIKDGKLVKLRFETWKANDVYST